MPDIQSRFRGCLLGLACGDAVGTTVEFCERGTFAPVTDMIGGGPFALPAGAWTDDTSMALCLATSLVECRGFDARDQMERYRRWSSDGYLSSTGRCFDIGNTVARALSRFAYTGDPFSGETDPRSAGNGCIMRLAPVPMFFYPNVERAVEMAAESARTTHGAAECLDACRLLAMMICRGLSGEPVERVLFHPPQQFRTERVRDIAIGSYCDKTEDEIKGTGYVIDCLEAAAWCFWKTSSFSEAVLTAANLGDDADTTAAVCGQIAGCFYGCERIPSAWLEKLVMADRIEALADQLATA